MKKAIILIITAFFAISTVSICFADVYVKGYYRKDGTYVPGHYRSSPDGNPWNNWSTKGNVNPYTGKKGYKNPYSGNGGYSNPYQGYSNPYQGIYDQNE